jgi:hypothetical protein
MSTSSFLSFLITQKRYVEKVILGFSESGLPLIFPGNYMI